MEIPVVELFKISYYKNMKQKRLLFLSLVLLASILFFARIISQSLMKSQASSYKVDITMLPKTEDYNIGSQATTEVIIMPTEQGAKISAFNLVLSSSGALNFITFGTPVAIEGSATMAEQIRTVTATSARLAYTITGDATNLPRGVRVPVNFKGIQAGTGKIMVNTTQTQITGLNESMAYEFNTVEEGVYTFTDGGSPSPTGGNISPTSGNLTPTGTNISPTGSGTPIITQPGGDMILKLKVKFQGITYQPSSQYNKSKVEVKVAREGFTSDTFSGEFTADASGVWSGSVALKNVSDASNYRVYVKGPRHLQKKVCVAVPEETAGGTYRCSDGQVKLSKGENVLDFSKITMLVGDLPDQDGVVDSYDISYIRQNLGSTKPEVLEIGDINLDGVLDSQDYSLVIASLNVKYDEE